MSTAIDNPTSTTENIEENPSCFVCGNRVNGFYFTLATIQTHISKTRIVEKISDLIGEKFMVIISEEDVICRSCTNLINTLDRLQNEAKSISDVVLTFLERKYSLDEGELSKQDPKTIQESDTFLSRRKRQFEECRNESEITEAETNKSQSSSTWMQCDKCQYTTQYNAYMVHHIRQHMKTAQTPGVGCILQEDINQNTQQLETEQIEKTNKTINKRSSNETSTQKNVPKSRRLCNEQISSANLTESQVNNAASLCKELEVVNSPKSNVLFKIGDNSKVVVQNIDGSYQQVNKFPLITVNQDDSDDPGEF